MSNLVVCCDGTWATPENMDDGVPTPTNVVQIYGAVNGVNDQGIEQKKYYHPGVGTEGGWLNKIVGGGTGAGLDKNIKSAYRWISQSYREGDNIYLFGFSRGAYTVRSLAGMISACGLLNLADENLSDDDIWDRIDQIFANYRRKKNDRKKLTKFRYHNTRKGTSGAGKTTIHFIGVWDTVGALGVPDEIEILNHFDKLKDHSFHDTELGGTVDFARHAVAMDEWRRTFAPTLWTKKAKKTSMKQIWFPGDHSDVGGGHPQTGLSDGALEWMMGEARECGLSFRAGAIDQLNPNPRDVLHNSNDGIYRALKSRPRNVPFLSNNNSGPFHPSALDRHSNPPLIQPDYWPSTHLDVGERKTVDVFARQKWNATGIFLEKGEKYELTATGQWVDASIKCGPGGTRDGDFNAGELVQMASSAWGSLENLFKKITGNDETDLVLTKRDEDLDWFALIGVIANGLGTTDSGNAAPHHVFLIGEGTKTRIAESGYLYAYANDAWQMYFNNRGSVQLTVKRTS